MHTRSRTSEVSAPVAAISLPQLQVLAEPDGRAGAERQEGSPAAPNLANGPWRVLVLDRDPQDPKWIIATVTMAADVRPAALDAAGRYTGWEAVTAWATAMVGRPVALVPVHGALAWRVDEGARPR